jgi:hypothetical protein
MTEALGTMIATRKPLPLEMAAARRKAAIEELQHADLQHATQQHTPGPSHVKKDVKAMQVYVHEYINT